MGIVAARRMEPGSSVRALVYSLIASVCAACSAPDAPAPDGLLRRGLFSEPATLDPHLSRQNEMASLLHDLFEGLVTLGPSGAIEPGVAESWSVSDDGLRYEFSLREGARWSDGSAVTAADFVASLRRVVDPATASPHPGMLMMIGGVEDVVAGRVPPESIAVRAPEPRRLVIELAHPAPYFLSVLVHSAAMPIHSPSVAEQGREFTRPQRLVSNGAYVLVARADYQYVELAKNEHYWNADEVEIERVRYVTFGGDDAAQFSAYRAGQLDLTDSVPSTGIEEVKGSYRDELVVNATKDTFYYGFNLRAGPLATAPRLREALSMSLSREIVVDRVTRFGEPAAYSFVPPVFGAYDPPELPWEGWSTERREAEAAAILAGEPDERRNPGTLRVLYNTNEGLRRITVAITSMWRESLGVETVLENQEFGIWLQTLGDPSAWDVTRLSWRSDFDDPFGFLEIFMSESPNNFVGFADPEYDRLIARSHLARDPTERFSLLRQAEQRLLDAHAIVPVFFYVDRILAKPWVDVGRRAVIKPLPTQALGIVSTDR